MRKLTWNMPEIFIPPFPASIDSGCIYVVFALSICLSVCLQKKKEKTITFEWSYQFSHVYSLWYQGQGHIIDLEHARNMFVIELFTK